MLEKIEGIVINERAYGETSKIIQLLTKEYGVIGIIAKGARTLKSDLRLATTKLTYGYFHMIYKENKLSTLTGVDIINNYYQIQKDITRISYASYMLELAEQVMKQNLHETIFTDFIASLNKLEEGFSPMVICNILELKYLDYLGVMPVIDGCSICGAKTSLVTLSSDKGGYVCKNCLTNERIVNEKTMKLIRMFYYVDINKIEKLEIGLDVRKEINNFLENYYERYTGLYLKSKMLLNSINKVAG